MAHALLLLYCGIRDRLQRRTRYAPSTSATAAPPALIPTMSPADSVLAFGSCAAQIKVAPYAEPASNLLKALVEAQIFITFLVSFILRVLPTIRASEPWDDLAYGWVLVVTLSGLLMTAVGLTAHQIWRRNVTRRAGEGDESGEMVLELSEGLVLERPLAGGTK